MDPTPRSPRAAAAWAIVMALTAPAAKAQQAGVIIPPPRPPALVAPDDGAYMAEPPPASAVPAVIPSPVPVEGPSEVQTALDGSPLDPVSLEKKGPHFILKKIRSWHWRRAQGKILGYPEEFKPRPLGSSVYAMGRTMAANGAEARLALHDYDFAPGTAELTDRGRDQLAKAAAQLAVSTYPLIVERTPGAPVLAEARRRAVLGELAAASFPIAEERVLVGQPLPFGMSGVNAQIISANALNRTQQYGPPIPINANGVNSPSGVTNQMVGVIPGQ